MRISDALARHLLDSAPDPNVVIDGEGYILYANVRVKEVLGYEAADLVDQHMEVLLPERFRSVHPDYRTRYFRNPTPRPMGSGLELFAMRKDGGEIPVEISLSPVTTDDEMLVSATIRDVSTQRDMQQQLEEASRAKSRFLAAASHDLRQPIQALNLLNSVASRAETDAARNTIIEKQQKSLDSMAKLLNSLLDISKLEAGIVKPDISDCLVQDIFEDLRAEFEEQAADKGLELIVDRCEDVARSDARLLTQILENFVSNAIRYTREGFVKLRCLHQDSYIRLEVWDTGLGISPDEIGRIFEEFHQSDAGVTRPDGLGLGLSIVKRTAELLGCKVDVTSEPGKGSTFSIVVPQGETRSLPQVRSMPRSSPKLATGVILVVDDELAVLEATAMLLEIEGFEVLTCSSEQEAVDQVSVRPPDLLVTDYHLRGESTGADVIQAVRAQCSASIPVILVSGDTSHAMASKSFKNASFMTKPVDTEKLLNEIQRRISTKK